VRRIPIPHGAAEYVARLSQRQRMALIALGAMNISLLAGLIFLLLRSGGPPGSSASPSPLGTPQRTACRQAVTQALLEARQPGLVQVLESNTVLIQIERQQRSGEPRRTADAAVWAALEAVGHHGACLNLSGVQVVVFLSPPDNESCPTPCEPLRAAAWARMPDLWLWSLGQIDDAELARRLDYQPPREPDAASLSTTQPP
jgi:hypothetical protein